MTGKTQTRPVVKYRQHRCRNCGHVQSIQTNHTSGCLDYCKGCSWKPSFGSDGAYSIPALGGQTYRRFECIESV